MQISSDNKKVAIVGTGMVGMSYAYALLNQGLCNDLLLIDINKERAEGESMDLNHGLAFAPKNMKISSGEYSDCADADIVVICAGVAQKEGESRLDLLKRNAKVFKSIVKPVVDSGFNGIFLIATNPVDIMTRLVYDLSGFPPERVIGSGTTLDTARLRYLIGDYLSADPKNIHANVVGEHGDSEFVPWSQAYLATKPILDICKEKKTCYCFDELKKIERCVMESAQVIIKAKQATYYGIGMALARITKAIFDNENSILTVSSRTQGEYGLNNVFIGLSCFINRGGAKGILVLDLTQEEREKLSNSAKMLDKLYVESDLLAD